VQFRRLPVTRTVTTPPRRTMLGDAVSRKVGLAELARATATQATSNAKAKSAPVKDRAATRPRLTTMHPNEPGLPPLNITLA